ncbi:hypothetical protein BOKEGFJH_00078 [Chlamydia avium]|nr:hypothetical protein BOKEGFJH_00078 [Chlamydia avium]
MAVLSCLRSSSLDTEYWILEVKVIPRSKENALAGFENDMLRVRVTEAPEKGKANDAIIALLSKELSLSKRDVTLISGSTSRKKKFLLPKVTESIVAQWKREYFKQD